MSLPCACGDSRCKADTIKVHKSVERLACYERTILKLQAALSARDVCWHCKVLLEPEPFPHCPTCPAECDDEACSDEGCREARAR